MAATGAPGQHIPGTMTTAAWGVVESLIAGTLLFIVVAAKAQDAPMAAHSWLFALAFAAGALAIGQRHFNALERGPAAVDAGASYNDGVVKAKRDRHPLLGYCPAFWSASSSPSSLPFLFSISTRPS